MKECKKVKFNQETPFDLASLYGQVIFSESTNNIGSEDLEIKLRGKEDTTFLIKSESHHRIDVNDWVKFHFHGDSSNIKFTQVRAYELYFHDRANIVKYRYRDGIEYIFVDE